VRRGKTPPSPTREGSTFQAWTARLEDLEASMSKKLLGLHSGPPDLVYHYTDAHGLLGMLEHHAIRATHARYLNDPKELDYLHDVASRVVTSIRDQVSHGETRDLAVEIAENASSRDDVYVACFSAEPDLLSQWRAYASDGQGYALGFKASSVLQAEANDEEEGGREAQLLRVVYEPSEQDALLGHIVSPALELFDEIVGQSREEAERIREPLKIAVWKSFTQLFAVMKHPGFREEQEWRAVLSDYFNPFAEHLGRVRFRPSRFGLTPYINLRRSSSEEVAPPIQRQTLPIERVVLGPQLGGEQCLTAATWAMSYAQYPIANAFWTGKSMIVRSEIAYRSR
jgi:hypothetical protein